MRGEERGGRARGGAGLPPYPAACVPNRQRLSSSLLPLLNSPPSSRRAPFFLLKTNPFLKTQVLAKGDKLADPEVAAQMAVLLKQMQASCAPFLSFFCL